MFIDVCLARQRLLNPFFRLHHADFHGEDAHFDRLRLPADVLELVRAGRQALELLRDRGGPPLGLLERCVHPGNLRQVRLGRRHERLERLLLLLCARDLRVEV